MKLSELSLALKVSLVSAATCFAVVASNAVSLLLQSWTWANTVAFPGVWLVTLFGLAFVVSLLLPRRGLETVQTLTFLGMATISAGMASDIFPVLLFFALGVGLLYRYDLFPRHRRARLAVTFIVFVPVLLVGTIVRFGPSAVSYITISYLILMVSAFTLVYLVFEQQLRQALASLSKQNVELRATRQEVARLEPLSALGENLSHVTHGFKNQLNQLVLARVLLDQGADSREVSELLAKVTETLNERVETLLLVSRAGFETEPEVFDAARVLRGVEEVFREAHPRSAGWVRRGPDAGPVLLKALRGDFVLLVENLLKNACEAVATRPGASIVQLNLTRDALTVANDGGAMEHCAGCTLVCAECPHYGRPGQTTKEGGSGHGLAQVAAACRRSGWTWRAAAEGDWTRFTVTFRG